MHFSRTIASKRHFGLGRKCHDPFWIQLCEDVDSFDIFRLMARNDDEIEALYYESSAGNSKITPLVQCLAAQLMDTVHFRIVLQNLNAIILSKDDYSNSKALEDGAFLLAQRFWTWQDLLEANVRERIPLVRQKLDNLADKLRVKLKESDGVECMDTLEAVTQLGVLLIDEMEFTIDYCVDQLQKHDD